MNSVTEIQTPVVQAEALSEVICLSNIFFPVYFDVKKLCIIHLH